MRKHVDTENQANKKNNGEKVEESESFFWGATEILESPLTKSPKSLKRKDQI